MGSDLIHSEKQRQLRYIWTIISLTKWLILKYLTVSKTSRKPKIFERNRFQKVSATDILKTDPFQNFFENGKV